MAEPRPTGAWLVEQMGPAWPERLGLDPAAGGDADLFCWFVACLLKAGERREERVDAAVKAVVEAGWTSAVKLTAAGGELLDALAAAGLRTPEVLGARLVRASATLCERHEGSLEQLAQGGPSLEELGGRLVTLGPGLGPGTALRFLRPLRDRWSAADEVPLDPAALASATHLGWLDEYDDLETAPSMLRRRLDDEDAPPPLPRVEDALERLGRASCRRNNTARCPLSGSCPARD